MNAKTKLLLVSAFSLVCFASNAQSHFGIKVGVNFATKFPEDYLGFPRLLTTIQVGGVVDMPVSGNWYMESGILLYGKGYRYEDDLLGETARSRDYSFYVQLPLQLLLKKPVWFAGIGPFAGVGVAGIHKFDYSSERDKHSLTFGNSASDDFSLFDYGIGAQAGINLGHLRLGAAYDFGLADLRPKSIRSNFRNAAHSSVLTVFGAFMF